MCDRPISSFSPEQIKELEKRLVPGGFSQVGFMGPDERLLEIYEHDKKILEKFGVTFDQVADKLTLLEARGKRSRELDPNRKKHRVDENILFWYDKTQTMGYQTCPFLEDDDHEYVDLGTMFNLMNEKTGEKINLNSLHTHMIKNHQFFEGLNTPYRLDAEKTLRILDIKQNEKFEIPVLTKKVWQSSMSSNQIEEKIIKFVKKFGIQIKTTDDYICCLTTSDYGNFSLDNIEKFNSYADMAKDKYIDNVSFKEFDKFLYETLDKKKAEYQETYDKNINALAKWLSNNTIEEDLVLLILSKEGVKIRGDFYGHEYDKNNFDSVMVCCNLKTISWTPAYEEN